MNIPFPKVPRRKTIDILIGSDHPELTLALIESYGPIGAPVARKTPLGYGGPVLYVKLHFLLRQSLWDPDLLKDPSR